MQNHKLLRRWRRIDAPGLELMTLSRDTSGLTVRSTLVYAGEESYGLRYRWELDASWHTRTLHLERTDGAATSLCIERTGDTDWRVDGQVRPDLAGCRVGDALLKFAGDPAPRAGRRRPAGVVRRCSIAHLPAVATALRGARPSCVALSRQRGGRRIQRAARPRRGGPRRELRTPVRGVLALHPEAYSAALAIAALCSSGAAYLRSWVSDGTIFRASSIFAMSTSAMTKPAFSAPASAMTSPHGATAIEWP